MRDGRRALLAGLALGGCASLPPLAPGTEADAAALLAASAASHGAAALAALPDLAVSYTGEWPSLIQRVQPVLVDAGHRVSSDERLLLRDGVVAQAHTGPAGRKHVLRRWAAPEDVRVAFDGTPSDDAEKRAAAALVADGYALFLLGPTLLAEFWPRDRTRALRLGAPTRVEGRACDELLVSLAPGLGFAAEDRLALYVDRERRLTRRIRFTLEGLESTRGAVAEVDCADHVEQGGAVWPTRFRERLLRPFPARVHDWRLTGLDLGRGLTPAEVSGPAFTGAAAPPARPLPSA